MLLLRGLVSAGEVQLANGGWPSSLEFLHAAAPIDFHSFVAPLADMTTLSYTATWGSYYDPATENGTVVGWTRGELEANPQAGMRALTFVQANSSRGVVVFRGTDLDSSGQSGQADACADAMLMSTPVPKWCSRFSNETLDYLAAALSFAEAAALRYPALDWIFTGHSLGALLAEVVAAVRGRLATVFSAPAVVPVLHQQGLDPLKVQRWQMLALYNEWDPLRYESLGELPGSTCHWNVTAPLGCKTCDGHGVPDLESLTCKVCFLQTHVWKKYLELVESGRKPSCSEPSSLLLG
mmetsp:Transcript_4479/g.10397  ORF Transcript_4479/g.10397 Transcript_4479/m.10397 type:complete len:295 (+) Transcript_4479:163-1047(+)